MNKLLEEEHLRTLLRGQVAKAGSAAAWATQHGFVRQHISHVLLNKKPITARLARQLGYEPVRMFRPRTT